MRDASILAPQTNEYGAAMRDKHPSCFSLFSALPPFVNNMDTVLGEIAYSLDMLKADVITMFTRYGHDNDYQYLGHTEFRPLWNDLNNRKAVVFIHPTRSANTNLVDFGLPQPILSIPTGQRIQRLTSS